MALNAGLDLPIMNPNLPSMMWAFKAYKVLSGEDVNSLDYIAYSQEHEPETQTLKRTKEALRTSQTELSSLKQTYSSILSAPAGHPTDCTCESCKALAEARNAFLKNAPAAVVPASSGDIPERHTLAEKSGRKGIPAEENIASGLATPEGAGILKAMETGMKKEGRVLTAGLLDRTEAMNIINEILIPALDVIGERFEKGKIFLPQLILAADVAKECFDVIRTKLAESGTVSNTKGKIILATVKGDIHDIGKNIVKVILENYGYEVIDLGKDVDPQLILKTAVEQDVRLVGLSALMTTTLGSMEETIRLLRDHNVNCRIMVGGAVLTEDYARKIGADFYSKDAKSGADIAKAVLG